MRSCALWQNGSPSSCKAVQESRICTTSPIQLRTATRKLRAAQSSSAVLDHNQLAVRDLESEGTSCSRPAGSIFANKTGALGLYGLAFHPATSWIPDSMPLDRREVVHENSDNSDFCRQYIKQTTSHRQPQRQTIPYTHFWMPDEPG